MNLVRESVLDHRQPGSQPFEFSVGPVKISSKYYEYNDKTIINYGFNRPDERLEVEGERTKQEIVDIFLRGIRAFEKIIQSEL